MACRSICAYRQFPVFDNTQPMGVDGGRVGPCIGGYGDGLDFLLVPPFRLEWTPSPGACRRRCSHLCLARISPESGSGQGGSCPENWEWGVRRSAGNVPGDRGATESAHGYTRSPSTTINPGFSVTFGRTETRLPGSVAQRQLRMRQNQLIAHTSRTPRYRTGRFFRRYCGRTSGCPTCNGQPELRLNLITYLLLCRFLSDMRRLVCPCFSRSAAAWGRTERRWYPRRRARRGSCSSWRRWESWTRSCRRRNRRRPTFQGNEIRLSREIPDPCVPCPGSCHSD